MYELTEQQIDDIVMLIERDINNILGWSLVEEARKEINKRCDILRSLGRDPSRFIQQN